MQLFAKKLSGERIFVISAEKQQDYFCEECGGILHVRSGAHRQPHFYHLSPPTICLQHTKSLEHIQTQLYLQKQRAEGEILLEHPFPSIGRIADAAWIPYKCVFEIQCSPISTLEVQERTSDYAKEGWQVIWLLHEKRFNRSQRASRLDPVFQTIPHYFTNINASGQGFLYDQFSLWQEGWRTHKLHPLPFLLSPPIPVPSFPLSSLNFLQKRQSSWTLFLSGDLFTLSWQTPPSPYLQLALRLEKKLLQSWMRQLLAGCKEMYLQILHTLLDAFAK